MTIQIEIEWNPKNLRRTAEHFRTTETGHSPVGFEDRPTLVEDYETFLLEITEKKLKSQPTLQSLREQCSSAFSIYSPVWVCVTILDNTNYVAGDLVTTTPGVIMRELGALWRRDNGVVASRTIILPIVETGAFPANIQVLTKL